MNIHGPQKLKDFKGQKSLIIGLEDMINGCKKRNEPLPHCAFLGPGGTGKTTIARAVANEMGTVLIETTGNQIAKASILFDMICEAISKSQRNAIILIDEAHDLRRPVQDALLPFLQDNIFDHIWHGRQYACQSGKQFVTIVLATTNIGRLGGSSSPLVQRLRDFQIEPYNDEVMADIGRDYSFNLKVQIDEVALEALVARCRNIPRELKKLMQYCVERIDGRGLERKITITLVEEVMDLKGIDLIGLRRIDRDYLEALNRGEKSLKTLASIINSTEDNVANDIEPYLMRLELVAIDQRRHLTEKGTAYLNAVGGE